jgi:hypothetical protein
VIGDVEDLRTPHVLADRRHPDDVTDAELVEAASATIAAMMADVRQLTRERRGAREAARSAEARTPRGRSRAVLRRVRRMWSRS